ncbi:MAG TPA: hypothetical protein VE439_09520 [Anaerolineae bacterium]|jgi:hypothetical protein|nr:hypothetical protein [Anaerolineae bacterium]
MAEDKDHVQRDTEEYPVTEKKAGRMMRKEEEYAEAEERPIYPITVDEEKPKVMREKRRPQPKKKS